MIGTTSLPTGDGDSSDSGSGSGSGSDGGKLNHYLIRVTPCEKFSFEDFHTYIKEESDIFQYVLSKERTPNEHFHLTCSTELNLDDTKGLIRWFLTPYWAGPDGKIRRGFGNKQYNCQVARDLDKAVNYTVKDKELIVYEGFSDEYIEVRKAESFKKNKPSNFKVEYRQLCDDFQNSDDDVRTFMIKYINLKSKYDQQVSLSNAYGYAVSNIVKRDNNAEEFVDNYLNRL